MRVGVMLTGGLYVCWCHVAVNYVKLWLTGGLYVC